MILAASRALSISVLLPNTQGAKVKINNPNRVHPAVTACVLRSLKMNGFSRAAILKKKKLVWREAQCHGYHLLDAEPQRQ
jgi:hypothetical protein